ncbi:DNRLRE domain-containing protein [Planctomycetota bacterium]
MQKQKQNLSYWLLLSIGVYFFPVVSYSETINLFAAKDTSLFSEGELSNGLGVHLFSGATAPRNSNELRRALMAFDFASIPAEAEIVSASLTLNMNKTISGEEAMTLHRVTSDWGEGESDASGEEGRGAPAESGDATWKSRVFPDVAWETVGGDFVTDPTSTAIVGGGGKYTWTGLEVDVQNWLMEPETNFGWILNGVETSRTAKRFDSREASNESNRPTLAIEFTLGGLAGDFDGNGLLDAADIDALTAEVIVGSSQASFDVTGDGIVDQADRAEWVSNLRNTFLGDSNLDGEFGSADLVVVFQGNTYEDDIPGNSTWETGDWNGDGDFDTSDLVAAFSEGAYENGPQPAIATVPEPTTTVTVLTALAAACLMGRRNRSVAK